MNKIKVLLIEDDRSISNFITATMDREGYKIMHALNGREGLSLSTSFCPNVILLDLGLPDMDGLDVLQKLRSWSDVPVIIISARTKEQEKVSALDLGADDYITKPYNPTILLLRISAVLKRSAKVGAVQKYHDVEVSTVKGSLIRNGSEQILTKNEMIIFQLLLDRQGEIVTRDALMTALWDNDEFVNDNALSVNISRLRGKLAELGLLDAIETRKKQGYVLK